MPTVYLCRHAESEANAEQYVSGWWDVPLTENGIQQAKRMAESMARVGVMGGIISSDLKRARITAGILAERLKRELLLDWRLRERDYGDWTGTPYRVAFKEKLEEWEPLRTIDSAAPPNGETLGEQKRRLFAALADALKRWPKGFIVVTHRGNMRLAVQQWMGKEKVNRDELPDPPDYLRIDLGNH